MIAAALRAVGRDPVHNRAGSNMSWGVATALLEQRGDRGAVRGRRGLAAADGGRARSGPGRALQPVSRPARPLRRARARSPTSGPRWSPSAPGAAASCSTPTTRWSPTSVAIASCEPVRGSPTSGSRTPRQALPELQHAHDAKHCRRCGSPYSYERAFVGHLGHYECPNCEADRPGPISRRPRSSCAAWRDRATTIRTPEGEARARAAAARALQRLQRARRAGRGAAARRRARARRRRARRGRGGVRAGGDDPRRGRGGLDPADQEPGRRERGPAHAATRGQRTASEGRDRPLDRAQRRDRRRARRLLDLGRRLRAARRHGTAGDLRRDAGTGDGAAAQVRGLAPELLEVEPSIARSLDRAVSRAGERLFALPTYTALIELRTLLSSRGLAEEFWR